MVPFASHSDELRLTAPDPLQTLRAALAGRYDVDRLIASGGMGSVFLGRDITLDRAVAIKVIAAELANSAPLRERFLREARTVARLRHPNIVAVYAAGESDGLLYFVMEFVDGESVRTRLERDGRWADAAALAAVAELATALGYAHTEGVVHRDVKPENILIDRSTGRAMLTDFGVAQALQPGPDTGRMTGTGMVMGSPYYMSPEQASGERTVDGRSDIYSLGLVAYEMFAGRPAIDATSAATALVKQITVLPPSLRTAAADLPAAAAAAIDRALRKSPEDRFADAAAFAAALRGTVPAAAPLAPRAGRRTVALVTAALLVASLAGAAWFAAQSRASAAERTARTSYLVAPFEILTGDRNVAWLREGGVSMLSLALSQWSDLAVVDYERSLDLLREAKVEGSARVSLEDARRMARRADVGTVVMGQITNTRDSLRVVARLYDVASGRKLDEAERAVAASDDPRGLFDALASDLLDLAGAPAGVAATRLSETTTSSVQAYRDFLDGVRALNTWQLSRADTLFRRAIAADSTFSLAYYRLANTIGWRTPGEPAQQVAIDAALRFAPRLPLRERGLVEAFAKLSAALSASPGNTGNASSAQADSLFGEAQRAYAAVIARDSTNTDAWFGLGDAFYHHFPDGWGQRRTVANWTLALRAFERTLALDSAFYLAYSHKIDLYQWASGQAQGVHFEGDSLRLLDSTSQRSYGAERIGAAQRAARGKAVADVRAWIRADPSPNAYLQLALIQASAPHLDSAVATLRAALARPELREERMRFLAIGLQARFDSPGAIADLKSALATTSAQQLKREGGGDLLEYVLSAGSAAATTGHLDAMRAVARLTAEVASPGASMNGRVPRIWLSAGQLAMGVPTPQLRAVIASHIAALEAEPGEGGRQRRRVLSTLPYLAYLELGDRNFLDTYVRWSPEAEVPELQALAALRAGDTVRARRLVRDFPSADSLKAQQLGQSLLRWTTRGRVLTSLGEPLAALRWYDQLDPTLIASNGQIDIAWPLWPRALMAAGDLHARAGETDAAVNAYTRALAMLRDADPILRPQVTALQGKLAELTTNALGQELK